MDLSRKAAEKLEAIRRVGDVKFSFRERFAAVLHFQTREPRRIGANRFGDLEEEFAAIQRRGFAPRARIECLPRRVHCGDDVLPIGLLNFSDQFAVAGIAHLPQLT